MRPVEELYREFCEKIARECDAEAHRYEENPKLQDSDRQFVSALRETGRHLRQEIRRLDANYKIRTG
jgi:hypothetical protein